jgi:hypothetical protein
MKPYYSEDGIVIYHGDCRELELVADALITDPIWPNSVFPSVVDPKLLLGQALERFYGPRVVIHLGGDSDPRFLEAVPTRLDFFRVCHLEYCNPSYKGRLLYTADFAYVFGTPPAARPGQMVIPGKVLSTKTDKLFERGTGRHKHKNGSDAVYRDALHPCPRRLQHVRWLCKWFGGSSVVDPFAGTGTTGVACANLGIPCTLIEIEERYCEIAVKRLTQRVLDLQASMS